MSENDIIEFEYDPHSLVPENKSRILAKNLVALRHEFQTNPDFKEVLDSNLSDASLRDSVLNLVQDRLQFGDESVLVDAIDILLRELDELEPKQYLVDTATGKIIKALEEDDIFTPPDYVNEAGQLQKSIPKVHPKICVALATMKAEEYRNENLLKKSQDPQYKLALEHLFDGEKIIEMTHTLLRERGCTVEDNAGTTHEIVFGSEIVDAESNSLNPRFHRMKAFPSILATKILGYASKDLPVYISRIVFNKTSKTQSYTAHVKILKPKELS